MSAKKEIYWRIGLLYLCLLLLGGAILWRVFYLQQVRGSYYRSLIDSITTKYESVAAERGNIYSHDGRLMATSLPTFEIRMDMKADGLTKEIFSEGIDSLSRMLSVVFKDQSAADYKRKLTEARKRGERYFLLNKNVTYPQLMQVKTFPILRLGQFKGGLIVQQHNHRVYPYRELGKRTIGYIRDASVQPVGLEGKFNEQLTGIPGKRLMQKVSGGQFLPINDKNEIDPQSGKDLLTTIDVNLQDVAEAALLKTLMANKADHGSCIVMEVSTGAIKAIANLGVQKDGTYKEDYNYAIGDSREPGSTFKLASMLALLEDGYIQLHDTVDLELGIHQFGRQTMRDAERHHLRRVDVVSAFAHSSNVGISKLVQENYGRQPEKFLQHLRQLGFDQKLEVEIPGEVQPYVKTSKDKTFTQYSLPWMAVGYELRMTPLQLLTFYNAVANNGRMMRPYIVQEIQEYGIPVQQFGPEVISEKICSEETLKALRVMLEAVVDSGTAKNLRNNNYRVAGKTGTAQIADAEHRYHDRVYQSSFAGYFPADRPLYSCVVVVNKPSNATYYGALVAAPVFKEIADKVYASNLSLHPAIEAKAPAEIFLPPLHSGYITDAQVVLAHLGIPNQQQAESPWVRASGKGGAMQLTDHGIPENGAVVPDVRGMGLRNALYLLEKCGLQVNVTGAGKVISQSLQPNAAIQRGQWIDLRLSMN
jgi:cell division protein FtsI (penicillin-binding protein 3)